MKHHKPPLDHGRIPHDHNPPFSLGLNSHVSELIKPTTNEASKWYAMVPHGSMVTSEKGMLF